MVYFLNKIEILALNICFKLKKKNLVAFFVFQIHVEVINNNIYTSGVKLERQLSKRKDFRLRLTSVESPSPVPQKKRRKIISARRTAGTTRPAPSATISRPPPEISVYEGVGDAEIKTLEERRKERDQGSCTGCQNRPLLWSCEFHYLNG